MTVVARSGKRSYSGVSRKGQVYTSVQPTDKGGLSISELVLTSAAFAGLTAGVFAFAAGLFLQAVAEQKHVRLEFDTVTWWARSQYAFERIEAASATPSPKMALVAPRVESPVLKTSRPKALAKARKRPALKTAVSVVSPVPAPLAAVSRATADEQELLSMQLIHRQLRGRFLAEVRGVRSDTPLQAASRPVEVHQDEVRESRARPSDRLSQVPRRRAVLPPSKPSPVNTQAAALSPPVDLERKLAELTTHLESSEKPTQLSQSDRQVKTDPVEFETPSSLVRRQSDTPAITPVEPLEKEESAPTVASEPSVTEDLWSVQAPLLTDVTTHVPPVPVAPLSIQEEKQTETVLSPSQPEAQQALTIQGAPLLAMTTQSARPTIVSKVVSSEPFGPPAPPSEPQVAKSTLEKPTQKSSPDKSTFSHSNKGPRAVEAFHWEAEIPGATHKTLSRQGSGATSKEAWLVTEVKGYWPTLSLRHSPHLGSRIPMISTNTTRSLEWIRKQEVRKDLGIVFGFLPQGFRLVLAADSEGQATSDSPWISENNGGERNQLGPPTPPSGLPVSEFVLSNARPGARWLHLKSADGKAHAVVALPVARGVATFVDLSSVEIRSLEGHVWDAGRSRPVPVGNARVSVAGLESTRVTVDSEGLFRINDQLIVKHHPLFLESEVEGGFTHRYSVDPESQGPLSLFRFSDEQLFRWIGQLKGGVHAESGVLVAALPEAARVSPKAELLPYLQSVEERLPFTPEVYTIAEGDRLEARRALDARATRVFGAEIPGGAHVLGLEDATGEQRWSRFFVADPGVVNVIGPE